MMTVALFIATIFLLILPLVENNMMNGKRQVIRELVETAWSTLGTCAKEHEDGRLSLSQAQSLAIKYIRNMRYGPEQKDYFWINDMHPNIIMHPYRPDLEGKDISDFADPTGKFIFMESVKIVEFQGAGYLDYQWQWKDDPRKIVPKISYVKGFEPWGWIIGTGIYLEDVREELARLTRHTMLMCLGILGVIVVLSTYIIWQGVSGEKKQKAAEKQAQLQHEQLIQADKMASLGTLVSGVAHEINNPITYVMLNAPILQKTWAAVLPILDEYQAANGDFRVGKMPYSALRERIPALLTGIADGAARVKGIVSDLRDFTLQSPSELRDEVNLNEMVKKASGLVNNLIKKSTAHFTEDLAPDLPRFVGNAQRIEQVIINLMVNACQSIEKSDAEISVSTGYLAESKQIILTVRDQGIGIDQKELQRIKDPFYTTKRDKGGTGLGLSICERIIRDHGGTMVFESEKGRGTIVTVSFPLSHSQEK